MRIGITGSLAAGKTTVLKFKAKKYPFLMLMKCRQTLYSQISFLKK